VSIWRSCLLVRRRCYEEKLDRNISARPELKVVAVSTHTPSSLTPATTPGPFPSTAFPYSRNLIPKTNQTKAQPKKIHTSLHHRIQSIAAYKYPETNKTPIHQPSGSTSERRDSFYACFLGLRKAFGPALDTLDFGDFVFVRNVCEGLEKCSDNEIFTKLMPREKVFVVTRQIHFPDDLFPRTSRVTCEDLEIFPRCRCFLFGKEAKD